MNIRNRKHIAALVFLIAGMILVFAECNNQSTAIPDIGLDFHLLIKAPKGLTHKRPGWTTFLPVLFGEKLDQDDLLNNASGTEGTIICADLQLVSVPPRYLGGLPCADRKEASPIRNKSRVVPPSRQATSQIMSSIPYIRTPRHSFVQTATPLLGWNPTGDSSTTYNITVKGDLLEWSITTTATEFTYPRDAPALLPQKPHRLIVEDNHGHSSAEEKPTLDIQFALLSAQDIAAIHAILKRVKALNIDNRTKQLIEAELYHSRELRADAIRLLEHLAVDENTPITHRRLGDLYQEVGLYAEARVSYERALEGYRSLADKGGTVVTLYNLGLICQSTLDNNKARAYFQQALEIYRDLGDSIWIAKTEARLVKTKPPR